MDEGFGGAFVMLLVLAIVCVGVVSLGSALAFGGWWVWQHVWLVFH